MFEVPLVVDPATDEATLIAQITDLETVKARVAARCNYTKEADGG